MGFLDQQERIVDMILTDEGKRQLSVGELEFAYYSFFDDGVEYDPYIAYSASLTEEQLISAKEKQTESYLGLEAVVGLSYKRLQNDLDVINVNKPLFTMPQGSKVLPRATFDPDVSSGSIQTTQQKISTIYTKKDPDGNVLSSDGPFDEGYIREKTSAFTIDVGYRDFFPEFMQQGFLIQVLASGSDGLDFVSSKKDAMEDDCYRTDLKVITDEKFEDVSRRLSVQINKK